MPGVYLKHGAFLTKSGEVPVKARPNSVAASGRRFRASPGRGQYVDIPFSYLMSLSRNVKAANPHLFEETSPEIKVQGKVVKKAEYRLKVDRDGNVAEPPVFKREPAGDETLKQYDVGRLAGESMSKITADVAAEEAAEKRRQEEADYEAAEKRRVAKAADTKPGSKRNNPRTKRRVTRQRG